MRAIELVAALAVLAAADVPVKIALGDILWRTHSRSSALPVSLDARLQNIATASKKLRARALAANTASNTAVAAKHANTAVAAKHANTAVAAEHANTTTAAAKHGAAAAATAASTKHNQRTLGSSAHHAARAATIDVASFNASGEPLNGRTIWMFWDKGIDDLRRQASAAYKRDYECVLGWRLLNPTWTVRVLDDATARALSPHYRREAERGFVSIQAQSDVLRVSLLSRYGGVWADISLCPVKPLDDFLDVAPWQAHGGNGRLRYGFYSFWYEAHTVDRARDMACHTALSGPNKDAMHSRLTPTWFLVATTPHNPAVDAWLTTLTGHLANLTEHHEGKNIPYYLAHCSLSQAYLTSTHVRRQLDSMVHEYMEGDCKEMLEPAVVADLELHHTAAMYKAPFDDLECVDGGFGSVYQRFVAAHSPAPAADAGA